MKLDAVIKKDNRQVAKGDILVPKNFKAPSQKYSGHFDWTYENKPYKASGEYVRNKNAQGSTHLLTIDGNNDVKGSLQFDLLDKVHLKCDVQKGGRRVSLTEMTAGPLKWDHFELDGHVDTDHPLPKKSVKTKAAFSYRANQVNYEGRVESDGERYAVEGKWRKQQKTPKQRQYVYSLALHAPQGSLSVGDDVIVEDAFTIRRMQSDATVKVGRDEYKMHRTIENQPQHFKFDNELTSNTGKSAKSTLDYTHVGGNRKLDAFWKYNEKQVQADIETLYEDRKMKIKAHSNIGCEKVTNWNCEVEGNVNDNYVLQAHEKLSPQQSDIGYLLRLDKFLDNEGKLEYHIDKRAQKFETKALMRNSNRKYHFDMNVDRDHGSLKLQTPTQLITDAQMRVVRKGPEEFEISSQAGGAARGKVKAHLKTADNDQLFQIQITDIKEPFELMLKNTKSGNRQTSQVEFTLDPLASKKTYGAESVIEDDGGKFRGMLVTLKHPKRSVHVELRRPAHNKYLFSIQPKMGSARRPTVAEMTYDKNPNGYHWEGSLTDPALKSPIKAKFDLVKSGRDQHNYGLSIKSEVDYSGQPQKLISHSLKIERKEVGAHRRRRAAAHAVKFEAEMLATHPASNKHLRLWVNVDRKQVHDALLPVHTTLGVQTMNRQKKMVEYSFSADSDAMSFTELKLNYPQTKMKARVDAVGDKHYKLAFYRVSLLFGRFNNTFWNTF
ncbi:unnamed protein product [Anisakis simplex]|uniref:Apolipoprotein B-100 (inferred by orthology to a human protein) n=1 Tax=Anisakis simplex TaxID=6269 RepID=A0A0M3IZ21_ANISI|nr:unnamed protein product [Anisakis simplex]